MIGDKLKELRENKGLVQTELSNLLNIKQGSYSNYELNKREPDIETIIKIAKFYNITTDYLLGYQKEDNKENLTNEEIKIINDLKRILSNKKNEN